MTKKKLGDLVLNHKIKVGYYMRNRSRPELNLGKLRDCRGECVWLAKSHLNNSTDYLLKSSSTIGNVHPTHPHPKGMSALGWPKSSSTTENVNHTHPEGISAYGWPKASSPHKTRMALWPQASYYLIRCAAYVLSSSDRICFYD